MRGGQSNLWDCFPTGRHYPGIAHLIAKAVAVVRGLAREFTSDLSWPNAALAVIDFETTGLDPEQDRVLEMGIALYDKGELVDRRAWLINPTVPVPEEARAVHGITDEDLANAPRFEDLAEEILALLEKRIPVAYNAGFDQRFLRAEFERVKHRINVELPPAIRDDVVWIDPLVWVREVFKYEEGSRKLTDVTEKLGIELGQAHRAADDAVATGKVLLMLAKDMPTTYGELIRIQTQYEAHQEAEQLTWRPRRN
jgi:DNA polymerase-3 subunit epsilon